VNNKKIFGLGVVVLTLSAITGLLMANAGELSQVVTKRGGQEDVIVQLPDPGAEQTAPVEQSDTGDLWFVELSSPPLVEGGLPRDTRRDKDRFRSEATKSGLVYEERYAFDTLWNGLSVRITPGDLVELGRVPGVVALFPVEEIDLDPQPGEGIDLSNALAMTGADRARSDLGYTGAGVRVGIIDSGIDYDHPDLGGCFGPGCRVETGWDFVGDAYVGPESTPVPDADPDDCGGHGTHVAGIVGADGTLNGVAPGVTLGAYRLFGCSGSTTAELIIAAMERALADGMDVINLSLSSKRQWPQYPTAVAADRLVNAGVVVVGSFGNAAANGLYSGGAPGVGDKTIGVASFQNSHIMLPAFESGETDIAYRAMANAPTPPTFGAHQIVYVGRGCNSDPLLTSPAGRIALIERGNCTFREKALHAFGGGATAAVIHNNRYGMIFGTVGSPPLLRSVVGITQADGLYLRGLGPPTDLVWTDRLASGALVGGGLISGFSSYGLTPDLKLKPDIGAPGGNVYSTYPLEKGGHASLSGTSMSAPHIAGVVALLLEAHPSTPAQAVRDILQNSADPVPNAQDFDPVIPETVHLQGAGMVDADDAILASTRITPGKLSLGEGENGPVVRLLVVENKGRSPVTYDLSHTPALATGGVIDVSFSADAASVSFAANAISIPPAGTGSVEVSVVPPSGPQYGQYGGYIVFTPRDGGRVYRVPYGGFVGDYQAIRVLTPTSRGFPWLARRINGTYYKRPWGEVFSFVGDDRPWILAHLDHQVRKLRMEIVDAVTGQSWHRARDREYITRNTSTESFFAYFWDGLTTSGGKTIEVPNGVYRIRFSVQKALGDDEDLDHWESWTSPLVTISRPGSGR